MCSALSKSGPTPYTVTLRPRPDTLISALPCSDGSEYNTFGTRLSASASSMVSGRSLPKMPIEVPRVRVLPGATPITLVPNWLNSARTNW